ncbi:Zn-ribbon domain-containing OB-fold protein [Variovorax paradoxus]|nr:Zn-ribbon domain-containing OB-fold protein [Variovorax paradoxus]MBT2305217.1 Zn-ribbon domain-containing OB-fold protein [Variovorax paradoxus]
MATQYQARELQLPPASPEAVPYWDAAAEGRLLVKHCDACGRSHHYPRTLCPLCGSDRTTWQQADGRGVIYALSVTRRGTPTPYAMAYVQLPEGVTLMTNIVDCDLDALRIGDPVEVVFVPATGGQKIPMFRPLQTRDA